MFDTLHLMFETQYSGLVLAVDEIAEGVRALGEPTRATYREFDELSSIDEDTDRPEAEEMIRRLVKGREQTARTARSMFGVVEWPSTSRPPTTSRSACRSTRRPP